MANDVRTAAAPDAVAGRRDLTALFDPRSVAVIGASDDAAKWGHGVSRELLAAGSSSRTVHLVNRRGGTVLGHPVLTRLTEVAGPVDLVAICVPAVGFVDAVQDAISVGARAIVAITAGLGEGDEQGRAIEREALRLTTQAGVALVGPNCLGVVDTTTGLHLAGDPFTAGTVAVLSQSGNLVLDLDLLLAAAGLGMSRFVSLGNQADVTLADLVRDCAHHGGSRAVAVYAEDLRDGRAFVAAAGEASALGKPVVVLAPGRSAAASRGAASHTGALTTPSRVVDAVCVAAGAHRVDTPAEMVDALVALTGSRRASGGRVGILTDGGGHGAIAADTLTAHGLDVPALSPELGTRLRAALWAASPVGNPVDLAGAGEQDPASYARGAGELLASDEVDAVLLTGYFGGYALDSASSLGPRELAAARELAALIGAQDKPVVVHTIFPHSESVRVLAEAGVPAYRDIASAARALRALVSRTTHARDLELPASAPALGDTGYETVRAALREAGVPFPRACFVRSASELDAALESIGFPLVLKAMGLLHKSDQGGVVLGLRDPQSARAAYDDLVSRLDPPAVAVEALASLDDGVELIVGVRQDPRCGPVVMVGLGGVLAEVLDDVALALAPVSVPAARELVLSLRAAEVLTGTRGRRPVDLDALAALVARVSRYAASHPELTDVEINPVLASAAGAVALDARAISATSTLRAGS
jgi:acyl-CoA synthetase (NDP forming)